MVIHFGKRVDRRSLKNITMNGAEIERVEKFKLLGVYFSSDLSWTVHVDYIVSKALRRLFVVCHLVNPLRDKIFFRLQNNQNVYTNSAQGLTMNVLYSVFSQTA